ncbi:MAG: GNAT family N-acetyltransferase [Spirulinaceae cyanobacterium]
MTFQLRSMRSQELDIVLNLIHRSIRELSAEDYTSQQLEIITVPYDRFFLMQGRVMVAEQNNQIIGVAKASANGWKTQVIEALFTHPDFVRQGVATSLVQEVERRARKKRVKRIVVTASLTAIELYQSLGYKQIKEVTILQCIPCLLFEKQFEPFTIIDRIFGSTAVICAVLFLVVYLLLLI